MARRLPIFLLIDVSESMAGQESKSVEKAIVSIVDSLQSDPYSLETVHISVIAFAGIAKTLVPLKDLVTFVPPKLPSGGGTNIGKALDHLMNELDSQVRKSTESQRGDWKPIVFFMTDGASTDNTKAAISRWKSSYQRRAFIVAISIGGQAKLDDLKDLTEEIVVFNDTQPQAFDKFARWISASISIASVGNEKSESSNFEMAELDREILIRPTETSSNQTDDRFVVLVGRCSTKNVPYLLKYSKELGTGKYKLKEALELTNEYFDFTDSSHKAQTVGTSALEDFPVCPACSNSAAFSICECGELLCSEFDGKEYRCGWCGNSGIFQQATVELHSRRGQG